MDSTWAKALRILRDFWSKSEFIKFIIVAICLTSTASAYLAALRADRRVIDANASEVAAELAADIELSLKSYGALLKSISGAVAAGQTITAERFTPFVRNFDLSTEYRGLFGIGWSEKISDQRHEILFIEPMNARNAAAIGFDMYSDPVRRKAMDLAAETGSVVASDPVVLVQEITDEQQAGILLYQPVYRPRAPKGYDSLRGFVYGIVRIEDMVRAVIPPSLRRGLSFALYQTTDFKEPPVYKTPMFDEQQATAKRAVQTPLSFSQKKWTLVINPDSIDLSGGSVNFKYYLLISGLFLTFIVYLLTSSVYARRQEIERSLATAREQNRIRSVLVRELNHRVKNSLATVLSLASLSRRYSDDIDEYYEGFSARVTALAGAHDILTRSNWHAASIAEIVQAELGAHGVDVGQRIQTNGPDLELKPSSALSLGLALHELSTNAAKYGALSVPGGHIEIDWSLNEAARPPVVTVIWRESGGPKVSPPGRKGFGTTLLTRLTARELSGTVTITYPPEGVCAEITMDWEKTRARASSPDLQDA